MNKRSVTSNSIQIKVKPPEEFTLEGNDTVSVQTVTESKDELETEEEKYLASLFLYLEMLESQKEQTVKLINIIKKRVGCKDCEK